MDPITPIGTDEAHQVIVERKVHVKKGKWKRFPSEVEDAHKT